MKLIILNGPPGVGKSTIASQLVGALRAAVLIDVDELRRRIPDYRERREESLRLVYEQTTIIIKDRLLGGQDVIIDKAVSEGDVLDTFITAGKERGAQVYEFLLFADKATVQTRASERGYRPGSMLTPEKVDELWERANALREQRAEAIVVDTTDLTTEQVLNTIKATVL